MDRPENIEQLSLLELLDGRVKRREPVYFETPNQSGIVFANTYLRHDRRSASDKNFWSTGNPNTQGFWKPLGLQTITHLDTELRRSPSSEKQDIEALLEGFDERASEARGRLAEIRIPARLSPQQIEHLQALGYLD